MYIALINFLDGNREIYSFIFNLISSIVADESDVLIILLSVLYFVELDCTALYRAIHHVNIYPKRALLVLFFSLR